MPKSKAVGLIGFGQILKPANPINNLGACNPHNEPILLQAISLPINILHQDQTGITLLPNKLNILIGQLSCTLERPCDLQ